MRNAILDVLTGRPSRWSVRTLVIAGKKLAESYLAKRAKAGVLKPQFFGLTIDDLAYDCIADLFERDEDGKFPRICRYFGTMPVDRMTEAQLLGAYRRLVFGRVTERLFEQYGEEDPQLARVIRNLKHSAKGHPHLAIVREGGELYIRHRTEKRAAVPLMPPEIMRAHICRHVSGNPLSSNILAALDQVFRTETSYKPKVHVTALAQVVRYIHVMLSHAPEASQETLLEVEEVNRFVDESVTHVRRKMQRTYLGTGKVDEKVYRSYFDAIHDILSAQFVTDVEPRQSYHGFLARYVTGLSPEAYTRDHRCYFEYLTRLTREALLTRVSREVW